jgi:hypothetical protein
MRLYSPTFPTTCLSPNQPGYGQVVASAAGRRRAPRKSTLPPNVSTTAQSSWSVVTPHPSDSTPDSRSGTLPPAYTSYPPQYAAFSARPEEVLHSSDRSMPPSTQRERAYSRFSPYPNQSPPLSSKQPTKLHIPPTDFTRYAPPLSRHDNNITLPPISPATSSRNMGYALPPISALEDLRGVDVNDSAAVLRRLSETDDSDRWPLDATVAQRRSSPPSSWPAAPAAFPSSLTHRFSEPAIDRSGSYSSRERLSVALSSEDSLSSHPSPISPPSPSTPVTPQSLPSGKDTILPKLSQVLFREELLPVSRSIISSGRSSAIDEVAPEERVMDLDDSRDTARNLQPQPRRPW